MFFLLSKALLFLLSPAFWIALLLGIYFFGSPQNKGTLRTWIIGLSLFFSNSVLFSEFARSWEMPGKKIQAMKVHDAAIVLGGMFEYDSDLDRISIRRQGDRIIQAVSLYKSKKVRKLILSGDSGFVTDRGLHEAKQLKKLLVEWGIPEADILTEDQSKNTHENAEMTAEMLRNDHPELKSFILVTSGLHMKRAYACFLNEGIRCTAFSTDLYVTRSRNYYWDQYLIPNFENLTLWGKLLKETSGFATYRMMGYL